MSFALVLKKTSWYRRRYSRPLRVKEVTSLFLGRFRLVFERIQNNGGRRLMHSGIGIIYLILLFKMSKSKSYPYYISIYILIKKCIA